MRIRLLPAAERDLEAGADFYESQRQGLGAYFNDSLTAGIESLQLYGGVHEKYHGFHRALAKRFPFAIYYLLDDNVVNIVAVLDCRQDPDTISRILESPRTT